MSIPSFQAKPSFSFMSFPAKRSGETEEQFNQRVLEFLKENNFSKEQQERWSKTKSISFTLPKDKAALESFMRENPDAELRMVSSSADPDVLKNGLRAIKDLGFLQNINRIDIVDKLDFAGKTINTIEDRDLKKLKDSISPPSLKPHGF